MSGILLAILVSLAICTVIPVSAEKIPDMIGSWDGVSLLQYSDPGGYQDRTPLQGPYTITNQTNRVFSGEESYAESSGSQVINERIAAVLSADGTRFWQDHDGSGLSFGEMVSDHEFFDYMLFPDDGPLVVVSHMVKDGTTVSAQNTETQNLVGEWNLTRLRRDGDSPGTGVCTIAEQEDRIFYGQLQVPEDDGRMREMKIVGAVGSNNSFYAVSDNGAFFIGSITGQNALHCVGVHPQDPDGMYLVDLWMSRGGSRAERPDVVYPLISGDWGIVNRTAIQNGAISDVGPVSEEWMTYRNQVGPFFSAGRYLQVPGLPPEMNISGLFLGADEAYLADAGPAVVIYQFVHKKPIDSIVQFSEYNPIEAIVIRKMDSHVVYLDTLVRRPAV